MKISKKLFFMNSGIVLVILGILFLSAGTFFRRYYLNKKVHRLKEIAKYIRNPSSQLSLEEIEDLYRVKVEFVDISGDDLSSKSIAYRKIYGEDFDLNNIKERILEDEELVQLKQEPGSGVNFLEYLSLYENDLIMIVGSPVFPIKQAIDYSTKFYLYALMAALAVSFILNYFFAKIFTSPLRKLTSISHNMADLSFDEKADIKTGDELEELAQSMNYMSEKLEETINKLEDSNIKLKKEIEKERMLEKLRKNFISSVNHELKTPIALISGYAEGLKDGVADESSREFYCQVIMDEAKKMDEMVKDLLLISQIESGYFKIKKVPFEISSALKRGLEKFEILIRNKNLRLKTNIDKAVLVWADGNSVDQVINNLLSNAVRYCPDGGDVEVKLEDFGEELRLGIYNSSNKIDKNELQKIWTPFYRLDKSGSKKYGGTGLGLSIVREILEKHGSRYGVDVVDGGVEFYIYMKKSTKITNE